MKHIPLMAVVLLAAGSVLAGGNGRTSGLFLTLPAGARSAAMGEGGIAVAEDASALHLNPAAMARVKRASVVGTHGAYIDGSFADQVTYVAPKSKIGAWGAGFQYYGVGSVDSTDEVGNPTGNISPKDMAITGGYARAIGPVYGGAGVKYISSELVDSASTVSLDLGVASKPLLKGKLTLGLVGQNLMGSLKYDQEENDLPMMVKAGAGYAFKKNWDMCVDAAFPKAGDSYYSVGTEYHLKIKKPWGMALRGGYITRTSDVDGLTGVTLGFGVRHQSLTVDYAFVPIGDVGTTHWITLGWKM